MKNMKVRFPIRVKVLSILMSLAFLLIIAVGFVDFAYIRASLEDRILSDLTVLVRSKDAYIKLLIEEDLEDVLSLAGRLRIREYLQSIEERSVKPENLRKRLLATVKNIKETIPVFLGIDFIGTDGRVILSTMTPQNTGGNMSDNVFFLKGREAPYVSDPYMDNGVFIYEIAAPVFSSDGRTDVFTGVIRVKINATRLYHILSDYRGLGATGDITLAKREGSDIVFFGPLRHRKELAPLRIPLDSHLARPMKSALDRKTGIIIGLDYRGVKVLAAYSYIQPGGWGLVVKMDTKEAFRPIKDIGIQLALFGCVIFLLSVLAINALSGYIAGPVLKLREGTEEIASGNLDFRVDVTTHDEIGDLAEHFNDMTARLKEITVSHGRLDEEVKERRKVEEQLREALKVKSVFTAMVSHELRTPLAAIREGISIVLDGVLGPVNTEQTDFLSRTKANVERLTRLINDILDFQKLEADKVELNIMENDLVHSMNEVCATMSPLAEQKGLKLSCTAGKGLPPAIRFDKDRIEQVLINLVNNAIKFTKDGSVTVSATREEDGVHVMVKDTGKGIRQKDMHRLFTSFEQLEKVVESKGGTGLGLAISKQIINRHGGKIWAESEFGKGTTVHFTLPV